MPWVALDHLVRSLEARGGDVGHGEALVVRLVGAQHRGVRHQREVNPMSRSATVIQTDKLYRQVSYTDKLSSRTKTMTARNPGPP
jgi:hypothetical protein